MSSTGRSRNGFLLLGLGDSGAWADILVGLWGKPERIGVVGFVLLEAFLTRKGFVSELVDSDFGRTREGVGSSNGDTTATPSQQVYPEATRVKATRQTVGQSGTERGSVLVTAEAADGFVAAVML